MKMKTCQRLQLLLFWTNYLDNETGKKENKAANNYFGNLRREKKTIIPRFLLCLELILTSRACSSICQT